MSVYEILNNNLFCQQFQNRRMKWKRSRKAQQEAKNKDNHVNNNNNNNDDKQSRERSSNSVNQSPGFKSGSSEKTTSNDFHFSKNVEAPQNLPPHPILHSRHLNSLPKEMLPIEENYSSNIINRQQSNVFSDSDDMIWRVV